MEIDLGLVEFIESHPAFAVVVLAVVYCLIMMAMPGQEPDGDYYGPRGETPPDPDLEDRDDNDRPQAR